MNRLHSSVVEHSLRTQEVPGSSPAGGENFLQISNFFISKESEISKFGDDWKSLSIGPWKSFIHRPLEKLFPEAFGKANYPAVPATYGAANLVSINMDTEYGKD